MFLAVFVLSCLYPPPKGAPMDTRSLLQSILDHIEDNLCSELSVSALAARAGFSPYHFHRIFRRTVGYPVAQYIRRRRLLHAVYAMRCGLTGIQAALQKQSRIHFPLLLNNYCKQIT